MGRGLYRANGNAILIIQVICCEIFRLFLAGQFPGASQHSLRCCGVDYLELQHKLQGHCAMQRLHRYDRFMYLG